MQSDAETPLLTSRRGDDRNYLALLVLAAFTPFLTVLARGRIFVFRDHADYFIPLRWFTADTIRHGVMPFWNPFNGSGEPWLANPQTGIFYPPTLLFLALPFEAAYILYLAVHLALLGCGVYLLARRWASAPAAAVAAVALMFSGPTLSLLDVSNNLSTLAWLPLVVLAALRMRDGDGRPALAALLIALSFLAGEPYLALVGAVLFAAIAVWRKPHNFASTLMTGALAIALSAVQLIPFLFLLRGSERTTGGIDAAAAFRQSVHPLDWLLSTISVAPFAGDRRFLDMGQDFVPSLYVGPIVVAFFFAAFVAMKSSPHRRAILTILGLALGAALLASVGSIAAVAPIAEALHLNVSRHPARHVPLVALAVALLAAIGIDELRRLSTKQRIAVALFPVVLTAAGVALVARSSDASIGRSLVSVAMAVFALLIVLMLTRERVVFVVIAIVASDMLFSGSTFFESRKFATLTANALAVEMRKERKVLRLVTPSKRGKVMLHRERNALLRGYSNLLYRQFDASTAAPVVSRRYLRLHDEALSGRRPELLDFLGVAYLVSDRMIDRPGFDFIARTEGAALYQRRSALPLATMWTDVESASDDEAALQRTLAADGPIERLAVSGDPLPGVQPSWNGARVRGISLVPELNRVAIDVNARANLVLMTSQLDAPGWRLSVDGKPATPLRAAGLFRAVAIPRGHHRIVWEYRPPYFTAGAVVSLLALAFVVVSSLGGGRPRPPF